MNANPKKITDLVRNKRVTDTVSMVNPLLPNWAAAIVPGIEKLNSAACIIHADETFLYANAAYCHALKISPEFIVGKTLREIVGADAYDIVRPNFEIAIKTKQMVRFGRPWHLPDGNSRWVEFNFFPLLDDGHVQGFWAMVVDSHDLTADENATIERERLLRQLSDSAGNPVMYVDQNLYVRFVNQPLLDWIDKSSEEVIGNSASKVFDAKTYEFYIPLVMRCLAGEQITIEASSKARVGEGRQSRMTFFPDRRQNGEITGVFIKVVDIEEDYQLRRQLIERERQLQLFTNNIPEIIAYLDTDRRYKFVNNSFLHRRKKRRDEVVGKTLVEALGETDAALATTIAERAFAGETVIDERLLTTPDGQVRWHRIRTEPDYFGEGEARNVQGIYVVGTDIHDAKNAHESLLIEKAELREAMDSLPNPMAVLDHNLQYQFANRVLEGQLGMSRDELVGRNFRDVINPEYFAELAPILQRVLAGETISRERLITLADGSERWMIIKYTPRRDSKGNIQGLYTAGTDIDTQKRKEIELRHANWLLSSHFENTPLAVIEWDSNYHVRRWSPQAEKIFGWSEAEVIGKRFDEWQFVYDEEAKRVMASMDSLQARETPRTTSLNRNYRKDGRVIWVEWYNSGLLDEVGNLVSLFSLAQDVTTRVLSEERLVHQATHDELTGLPNRTLLQERLNQAIIRARRSGLRVAALFIDLDRFKDVNDTLGHRIGDELLREMGRRLLVAIRESDLLVRLSGDEFMVVIEHMSDLETPQRVATKLLGEICRPINIEGHEIHITGSIGISLFPDDASDTESLLRNADMAMYCAKNIGKNTFQPFTNDMAEHSSKMRLLENALRAAITRDELKLAYLPKVDIASNQIVGVEALIRWDHPTRGELLPHEFLELAEETGLVHDIGLWVLDSALQQLRQWQDSGITNIKIAINLSAGQFRASHLTERIRERIVRFGVDARNLEVEVTETGLFRDPEGVGRTLSGLRELGITVAIDDFGTGYSSLSHLKRFPIDTLKIDKSFIADLLTDADDRAIVTAVIALAKALEINVIAEGVETEPQRAMLMKMGCHAYQGFLFAKPLSPADITALLRKKIH